MDKIEVSRDFLYAVSDALDTMIGYADDGVISRGDPDFKQFFDELDKAYNISNKLENLLMSGDESDEES